MTGRYKVPKSEASNSFKKSEKYDKGRAHTGDIGIGRKPKT
jgi:hypothetical protein